MSRLNATLQALQDLAQTPIHEQDDGTQLNDEMFLDGAPSLLAERIRNAERALAEVVFDRYGRPNRRLLNSLSREGFTADGGPAMDEPDCTIVEVFLPDGEHYLRLETTNIR